MPIIEKSTYKAEGFWRKNAHLSTILGTRYKKYPVPNYTREKITTDDGDFLNLDWRFQSDKKKLVILFHGLEGDSKRTYLNTCSDYFYDKGFNILAWNHRSCGGEMNQTLRLYHHGVTDDANRVIEKSITEGFENIYLIGYSMGGAIVVNYMGQYTVPAAIKAACVFSIPISLKSCSETLKVFPNTVYLNNFKKTLVPKFEEKAKQFPGKLNEAMISKIKSFDEIDEYFTAPLHGYESKEDYYHKASPSTFLDHVKIPTLIVNAANDPFLGAECYPKDRFKQYPHIFFEVPKHGGHCAFPLKNESNSWCEIRAFEFFNDY
ncbi:MAG: alpha/beta fold hydrolase [Weeksellaceae bacterium]|nr:alpha/beta fold hydrolase [Weeksellaceae bacterium]